ncbi:MAG: hypothetical protein ACI9XO_002686 [Paraglaciecola sp.]|jgi:hypothetical protein
MKQFFILLIGILFTINLAGQNIHGQLNFNTLRPSYKTPILENIKSVVGFSAEFATGFDHLQIGIETRGGIVLESFLGAIPDTSFSVNTSFSGIFLRANFSSIPAYRLGVITKIGIGYFDDEVTREIVEQDDLVLAYPDKIMGVNAGIGFSGPIQKRFHWEFMYQLSYHQRPELNTEELTIDKHNAWQNTFKLGVSMNLIFGKVKKKADEMISGRGF